jgi:adenosylcobinamide-phosphate synthase
MSLLIIVIALLLEQLRPLTSRNSLNGWLNGYVGFFQQKLDGGERKHGQIALILALLIPLMISVFLYWFLAKQMPVLAWAFCVFILYLTMGFRQFSHYFTDIHKALRDNNLQKARHMLALWRNEPCDELSTEEVIRLALEEALLATHRNVFAVVFWFVIFFQLGMGPSGAILYRLARFIHARWTSNNPNDKSEFGKFAAQVYHWIEWLPLRMTAATFAIVGNFEDAVYCWRTQSASWHDPEAGIVLASGAGALGVRLGMPVTQFDMTVDRPEMGAGDLADVDFMQSAIGLVWRAMVFWLILLLLLTLSGMVSWVGI